MSIVLVRPIPKCSTSRAQFSNDRPLPSVRAIGTPKRAAGEHTRRSHASAIAQPAPAAMPSTWAMVGTATRSSRATHDFEPALVLETVLARRERRELADVGAGAEDPAGRANDERAKLGRRVDALAGVGERVVHRPRHRVAGLRPVDGEERDRTARHEDGR